MASVPRTGGVSSSKTPLHTFELIRRSLLPVLISLARACKRPPHWLPVALDRRHFGTQFGRLFGKSISLPSRQNCLSGWGHQCGGANNHRHHGHPVLPSHVQGGNRIDSIECRTDERQLPLVQHDQEEGRVVGKPKQQKRTRPAAREMLSQCKMNEFGPRKRHTS